MTTLLHIDASPRGEHSISRQISGAAVEAWKKKNPEGRVITRDLMKSNLTFVDVDWIMASFTPKDQQDEKHQKALDLSNELVAELLSANMIVIGTPMYNFAIPAVLKAWVDHVVRGGMTFKYGPAGPQGLATDKKAIIAVASGGVYAGTPIESCDQEIPYLKHILGFIGITDVTFIHAGGTSAVAQKKTSLPEFIAPFIAKAHAAV